MRLHVALAGMVLVAVIGVVLWRAGGGGPTTHDSLAVRAAIASGPVAVDISVDGSEGSRAPVELVILPGEGWTWTQRPTGSVEGSALSPGLVVSNGRTAVSEVAAGCYAPIAAPALPAIPGVTLARDLRQAGGRSGTGDRYEYQVGPQSSTGPEYRVSEDLSGIAQSHRYRAVVRTSNSGGIAETFTIRAATAQEQAAARRLISTAQASKLTTFSLDVETFQANGTQVGSFTRDFGVLEGCPAQPIEAASVSTAAFPFFTPAGFTLSAGGGQVKVEGVIPVAAFERAPTATTTEGGSTGGVPLRRGAIFGQVTSAATLSGRATSTVFRVVSCDATAWFPCR